MASQFEQMVLQTLGEMKSSIEYVKNTLEDLQHKMNGNGQPGVLDRLRAVEVIQEGILRENTQSDVIDAQQKSMETTTKSSRWTNFWLVLSCICGSLATVVLEIIRDNLHHLPVGK